MGTLVDRLEELLAALADEDENEKEEEREDVPALADPAVPAVSGGNERRDTPASPAAAGDAERFAAAAAERDAASPVEERRDGPEWTAQAALPSAEAVWRRQSTDQTDETAAEFARTAVEGAAEAARERLSPEQGGALARAVRREAGSGLEGLYRQAVQASRPAAPQAAGAGQGGRTLYAVEPERTAGLTVDELDRAVRRDSWRYDGGMTIF